MLVFSGSLLEKSLNGGGGYNKKVKEKRLRKKNGGCRSSQETSFVKYRKFQAREAFLNYNLGRSYRYRAGNQGGGKKEKKRAINSREKQITEERLFGATSLNYLFQTTSITQKEKIRGEELGRGGERKTF